MLPCTTARIDDRTTFLLVLNSLGIIFTEGSKNNNNQKKIRVQISTEDFHV